MQSSLSGRSGSSGHQKEQRRRAAVNTLGFMVAATIATVPAVAQSGAVAPTVVVLPFTTAGRGDTTALRQSADRVVAHLNRELRADTRIHWLEYQPMRRPRDPRSGRTVGARYGVVGLVRVVPRDSVWVRFELVAIETVTRIMRDSVRVGIGAESTLVAPMALRLIAAVREAERPAAGAAPDPRLKPGVREPGDSVPAEAAGLYQRALVRANRSDTAGAVQLLRMALTIAPRYADACETLRRLRPGESCP